MAIRKKFVNIRSYISIKTVIITLAGGLLAVVMFYGYLVQATITNIIERKNMEQEIGRLSSSIGELEARYGDLHDTLTYEHALFLGFEEPERTVYATRKRLVQN